MTHIIYDKENMSFLHNIQAYELDGIMLDILYNIQI